MNIAAAMMSILFEVSEAISAENCIGSTFTAKPASLPTSVIRSTITPWISLVLVSRKVKGTPVGVEPTFRTCCAEAGRAAASDNARSANWARRLKGITRPPWGLPTAAPRDVIGERLCGRPVRSYFHQYEIVVTFRWTWQAIFMHMKAGIFIQPR